MASGALGDGRVTGGLSAASVDGDLSGASVSGVVAAAGIRGGVSAAQLTGALSTASVSGEVVPGGDAVMPQSYAGPYEADARFAPQSFGTARKYMERDFAVRAINYTEAPNDSGGVTITIGG